MSSLVADTESVAVVLDAIVARIEAEVFPALLSTESNTQITHSPGLHLGSPLIDSRFLQDDSFSAIRLRSVTQSPGRKRGWALVEDTIEVDLCWDVSSGVVTTTTDTYDVGSGIGTITHTEARLSTAAGKREGLRIAQRKAARIGELLTDRSGHGPFSDDWPRRWNPRIVETRERFALWADGHVQFVIFTLSMLFTRQEKRGS